MTLSTLKAGLALGMAVAAGCATMGVGTGSTPTGKDPVTFNWKGGAASDSGTMTASFADGQNYTGQFFQITSNTTVDTLGPLWAGWGRPARWGGWADWQASPDFVTHYSGRVVANLTAADGSHMRCRFQLIHPDDGMTAGGAGVCQLPGGQHIDAQFPRA